MKFLRIKWLLIFMLITSPCFAGLDYDKTDDSINCGSPAAVDDLDTQLSEGMSISLWMNSGSVGQVNGVMLSKDNAGVGMWVFYQIDSQRLGFYKYFDGNDLNTSTNTNVYTYGQDHHIALTWTGGSATANVIYYVDGSVASQFGSSAGSGSVQSDAAFDLYIGNDNGADRTFDNELNEIALWNTVLTPAEISVLASSKVKRLPLQIQPDNLKLYLPLDEVEDGVSADGIVFDDLSGNGVVCTGSDGANNTGFTSVAERILTYP